MAPDPPLSNMTLSSSSMPAIPTSNVTFNSNPTQPAASISIALAIAMAVLPVLFFILVVGLCRSGKPAPFSFLCPTRRRGRNQQRERCLDVSNFLTWGASTSSSGTMGHGLVPEGGVHYRRSPTLPMYTPATSGLLPMYAPSLLPRHPPPVYSAPPRAHLSPTPSQ